MCLLSGSEECRQLWSSVMTTAMKSRDALSLKLCLGGCIIVGRGWGVLSSRFICMALSGRRC